MKGKLLGSTKWDDLNKRLWGQLAKEKADAWNPADPDRPDNQSFSMLLVPNVSGGTLDSLGNGIGGIADPATNQHHVAVLLNPEPQWSTEQAVRNAMLHELGHAMGSLHTPPLNTERILFATKGCALHPKTQIKGPEVEWPNTGTYASARLGVPGYDLVTSTAFEARSRADLMTYCDQKWVADYSFGKWWRHNEERPGGPMDLNDPVVTILNPVDNATVSGPFQLSLDVRDDGEIVKVWYTVDGGILSGTLAAPYTTTLDPAVWVTSPDGWHQLTGWARDRAGRETGTTINIRYQP